MFTGIIEAIGKIALFENKDSDVRLGIHPGKLDLAEIRLGDSIAVQGVCLTVAELDGRHFYADVSAETLRCTALDLLKAGSPVNLERSVTPATRLGGHLVSGHVDGVGRVVARTEEGRSVRLHIEAPRELAKYIAAKGAICADGVSLTVNAVNGPGFEVNLVPHTLQETTLGALQAGDAVNLEVDMIARYLERLISVASGILPPATLAHPGASERS
ncbi:MAG: riboflavin synthase [Gammaproteobacteria bacterium]|nr:riboflavin synthase [Gammaproteobacteria bacterium]